MGNIYCDRNCCSYYCNIKFCLEVNKMRSLLFLRKRTRTIFDDVSDFLEIVFMIVMMIVVIIIAIAVVHRLW
jgi:hypothetical protein